MIQKINQTVQVANRHKALGLTDQDVLSMYENMLKARRVDERLWLLNRAGKIPFVVSCQGQEAAQVGAAFGLNRDKDYVAPYYRDYGFVFAWGMTIREMMLNNFAKAEDPNSGGRQMPGHFGYRKLRMLSHSSPVTTQNPHAVGIALAAKIKGDDIVSFVTFGEGSSNQGDFHEAANFAAVHKLPVIFMCENNHYAISVSLKNQVACAHISDRAIGYGMYGESFDGNDPLAAYAAVKKAADRAHRGEGPTLLEANGYRLMPHTSDDNDMTYRTKEEVNEAKKHDGVLTFAEYLRAVHVLTEDGERAMEERIRKEIDAATNDAEKAPFAEPDSVLHYVYEEKN
ncbi:thiamine pyrophosphate-dependent dehydrogenase E1 component subunit alpha [Sporolactobacillus terrae]|uniref:2-oxoisovalerate dehydrogenase subunit alpha n=1 Tax=Sporolactobacillus terrae TaxID=269673 RepID=A0A410D988_9BACL|nr:thiamine pyrophosphate-dependent dehydrogenase E1 component subunit alpha [Sporolactobacillus terrae]QAA22684.1 transketolase [Sporolactobacillus terrae]QAA25657.1 transketolase [Sporolactobacillus terrae]UAK17468.1 thiamine pyrophosphate-dependent dehydrogenase E1 component subunit alpha [Sporolactobacillus terrae]BBN99015.1 2-oxoisovalerate dehydrogenase subunit alpha [Sporolactobacillus terrae]